MDKRVPETLALQMIEEDKKGKRWDLLEGTISYDEETDEAVYQPLYDKIIRCRRITGYISNTKNFNDAKRAEAQSRLVHMRY